MMIRRRPVKVWQVVLIAVIVIGIFLVMALMQGNYNIPNPEDPFSQASLEKVESLAGAEEELYATGFTYLNSEAETFVLSLTGPGENGRHQNWNLILYTEDGRMPYRMEKRDTDVTIPAGSVLLSELFPKMNLFRDHKGEVFKIFEEQAKAGKEETNVQLDLRDRFGEEDLLLKRESSTELSTAASGAEPTPESSGEETSGVKETRIPLTEKAENVITVTISSEGVSQKAYQPGDCGENSFVLYRSGNTEDKCIETLLAVVNVEEG